MSKSCPDLYMTNMDIPDWSDHKEQDTTADNMAGASDEELREVII